MPLTNNELTGFRHPVTAQVLMMTPDDAQAYLHFTDAFRMQFHPQGMLEEQLAQSLADAQWRLNHARALETNIFSVEAASFSHIVDAAEPNSQAAVISARRGIQGYTPALAFSIYEQRLNRQFHQNLKLLRELQAERRLLETAELDQAAQLLVMERTRATAGQPLTYSPADDGFVFSIPQIENHIRRRQASQSKTNRAAAA